MSIFLMVSCDVHAVGHGENTDTENAKEIGPQAMNVADTRL